MQTLDTSNDLFLLAADMVNHTSRHIFLTGKAGTGKTTFLKFIRENCPKQIAVVAPTGVAAINAGGVTIHSFFQLPLSPFIPEARGFNPKNNEVNNSHSLISRLRLNTQKKKILQELELLIIDEISMVRCDTLDAIDLVLRHARYRHSERFGGVQVLFIGDMFQLPPVIKDQEWNLLAEHYNSPYFFDSKVMKEDPPAYIEFTKIYRQTEEQFIKLLNQVRNNELDEEGMKILQSRVQSLFNENEQDGYIVLTTHNEKAKNRNADRLTRIENKLFTYKADILDDFPENAYPADVLLQLKVGAQVMFIKNDTDKKQYFNGKIGVVTELKEDKIMVQCKGETEAIEVKKEKWENIRYTVNKATRQLEEEVLGSFIQYPVRLAWAITIHKSQGLSFQKAIIDAGAAFSPGQVYVALSRCTNLEGMILQSHLKANSFLSDPRIVKFLQNAVVNNLNEELETAKKQYQLKTLLSLFDFKRTGAEIEELKKYLVEYTSSFNAEVFGWIEDLLAAVNQLQNTAEKFHAQLKTLFEQTIKPEENILLQERIKAAAVYFSAALAKQIEAVSHSAASTDSRIHAKEYNEMLREIFAQLSLQKFLLQGFSGKFNMENFHLRKKSFVLPPFSVNAYAGASQSKKNSIHPALYQQLKNLRDNICAKKDLPIYLVAGSNTLEELTTYLPLTLEDLAQISGFGKSKLESYGDKFLEIIREYCKTNNLNSCIAEKASKRRRKETKEQKIDTKYETFRLYKNGMSVLEIAKERNFTQQTIEGHLAYYVGSGEIKIEELISREKMILIEPAVKNFTGGSITPIKETLGDKISFGEIRLVLAWFEFQKKLPTHEHH